MDRKEGLTNCCLYEDWRPGIEARWDGAFRRRSLAFRGSRARESPSHRWISVQTRPSTDTSYPLSASRCNIGRRCVPAAIYTEECGPGFRGPHLRSDISLDDMVVKGRFGYLVRQLWGEAVVDLPDRVRPRAIAERSGGPRQPVFASNKCACHTQPPLIRSERRMLGYPGFGCSSSVYPLWEDKE